MSESPSVCLMGTRRGSSLSAMQCTKGKLDNYLSYENVCFVYRQEALGDLQIKLKNSGHHPKFEQPPVLPHSLVTAAEWLAQPGLLGRVLC